jgi:acyl-CoA thioester hydrolase
VTGQIFRYSHRVTYAECTIGNHVYYARYLDILEAARGEFFRHLHQPFLSWQEKNTIFPIIECRLCYKGPARYDDVLTVELSISHLERVRLGFAYRILDPGGRLLVEAATTHVCANIESGPKRIPGELAGPLRAFLPEGALA